MKGFGLWALFFLVGTGFLCLGFSSKASTSIVPGITFARHQSDSTLKAQTRKLKENIQARGNHKKKNVEGVNINDYHPIDPAPSSKASVRPGPIQHGSPLMPYIPKPSPPAPTPSQPKHESRLRLEIGVDTA